MNAPFSAGRTALLSTFALLLIPASGPPISPAAPARSQGPHPASDLVPTAVTVIISFDDRRKSISVDKPTVEAEPGTKVQWKMASDHAWAVIVPSQDLPFGRSARASGIRGRGAGQARGAAIRSDLPRSDTTRRYKYFIAVYDGEEIRILDPEVVVPGT